METQWLDLEFIFLKIQWFFRGGIGKLPALPSLPQHFITLTLIKLDSFKADYHLFIVNCL